MAVVGVPDAVTGERACAVIVLAEGAGSLSLTELVEFCREQKLANQKIPERLEIVDQLPRNALGKILKRELRSTYSDTDAAQSPVDDDRLDGLSRRGGEVVQLAAGPSGAAGGSRPGLAASQLGA